MKTTLSALAVSAAVLLSSFTFPASAEGPATKAGTAVKTATNSPQASPFMGYLRILNDRQLTQEEINRVAELAQEAPNDPHLYMVLGLVQQRGGYLDLAAEQYEKSFKADYRFGEPLVLLAGILPRLQDLHQKMVHAADLALAHCLDANVLGRMAMPMYLGGEPRLAELLLKKSIGMSPSPARMQLLMFSLLTQKKGEEALHVANLALTMKGLTDDLRYDLLSGKAQSEMLLKNFRAAADTFVAAIKVQPLHEDINLIYGQMALNRGMMDHALRAYLLLMAQSTDQPDFGPRFKKKVVEILPQVAQAQSAEIIAEVQQLLSKSEYNAIYHFALGDVYDQLRKPQLAMAQYKAGLVIDPKFARGYMRLGQDIETYQKDYATALNLYDKAYNLNQNDPQIQARRARLTSQQSTKRRTNDLAMRLKTWLYVTFSAPKS